MAFDPNPSNVAYLVVGSTGTGKSSLINLFTNDKAHVGHGAQAGTTNIHMYKHTNGKDILIDTVGIEDPNGATDEQIMIQTLRYLQTNKIEQVAIIWTVNPTPRASQPLQKQAKYIDSLRPISIWDSVIIIVKQAPELESNSQGAREAAKKYHNNSSNIPVITYNCVDWFEGQSLQQYKLMSALPGSVDIFKQLHYMTEKEVKKHVEDTLFSLKNPSCQVIFSDSKCIKCGVIGDERCMPEKCHAQMTKIHEEGATLDKKHEHTGTPNTVVKDVKVDNFHTGKVERFHPGCVLNSHKYFGPITWNHQSKYDCCGQWKGSEGCTTRYKCCGGSENSKGCKRDKIEVKETLMSCCNMPQEAECGRATDYWTCCKNPADSEGCVQVCQLCRKPWNNDQYPGCMAITQSISAHQCEKIEN